MHGGGAESAAARARVSAELARLNKCCRDAKFAGACAARVCTDCGWSARQSLLLFVTPAESKSRFM